jgi:cell division protein FtsQ
MKEFFARVKSFCLLFAAAMSAACVVVLLRQHTVGGDAAPVDGIKVVFSGGMPLDLDEAEEAVAAAVGDLSGQALSAVDLKAALSRVLALGWVARASVSRAYPGILLVKAEGRKVIARIYKNGSYFPVDADGNLMDAGEAYASGPAISGPEANLHAAEMLGVLEKYPKIYGNLSAMQFVNGLRWNLVLYGAPGGVLIKLPSDGVPEALAKIDELDRRQDILARDIAEIELRDPSKTLVKPRR